MGVSYERGTPALHVLSITLRGWCGWGGRFCSATIASVATSNSGFGVLGFGARVVTYINQLYIIFLEQKRDWYFIAEPTAPAPHLAPQEGCAALHIVLVTVPRVSRSREHFPDGFDLHLPPWYKTIPTGTEVATAD